MIKTERVSFAIVVVALLTPVLAYSLELLLGTGVSDSSIFRYIGRVVANGGVMYQIAWDNKGPMLLFPNVLGYLIPGIGNHGPGFVFMIMCFGAIWFFFKIARMFVSELLAAALSILFAIMCLGNGAGVSMNCQEVAALFFILPGVYFTLADRGRLDAFLLGVCVACVFLIKANLVSFGGAAVLTWFCECLSGSRDWKRLRRRVLFSFLGFATVLCVVTSCYAIYGAAYDMWDATFFFGFFEYCQLDVSWFDWWRSYLLGSVSKPGGWVLIHYSLCMIPAVMGLWYARKTDIPSSRVLYLAALLAFDLGFTFGFKTFYSHYLIVSYAEVCILMAIACDKVSWRIVRYGIVLWGIGTCCLFAVYSSVGVRNVVTQRCNVADSARFFTENYKGGRVIVDGGHFVSEVMNELNLCSPQKYYNVWMNYHFAGEQRRREIREEFESHFLNAPTGSCFVFEQRFEKDLREWFPFAFDRKMKIHRLQNGFSIGTWE